MQSFDAKRISPAPAAAAKPQKTGGGDGGRAQKKIVTLSHSPRPVPRGPSIALEKLGGGGLEREQTGGAAGLQGPPRGTACHSSKNRRTFGFPLSGTGCPALPQPALNNRVLLGLSHTVLPVTRGGKRRGSFLQGLRRPGRAQPPAGAAGSAPPGQRNLAPSPAPARTRFPGPFLSCGFP